jgi:hypothetical protein
MMFIDNPSIPSMITGGGVNVAWLRGRRKESFKRKKVFPKVVPNRDPKSFQTS